MSTPTEPPLEGDGASLTPPREVNHLLQGPVLQSLFKLAGPIVLTNIIQSAYQMTDAFWVGRLGGNAVAAVSVSFPIIFLLMSLGIGLGIAGTILVAHYAGANNPDMVNKTAGQTLLIVAATSILLSTLGLALSPSYLSILDVAPEVLEGALGFLQISLAGILFTFGFFMFQSLMRGVGEVKLPLYIVTGSVLLNFIVDPLLIFGWGPLTPMGVAGAALATLLTQGLALLVGCATLFTGKWGIKLSRQHFKPDIRFIRRTFRLGIPASVEMSSHALGMNVMILIITGFGTAITAVYGIVVNVLGFVLIPAMGLSMATTTLIGQNIGAGQVKRAVHIARLSAKLSFAGLTLLGVVIFAFAHQVIQFFVPNDNAVIEAGGLFLHIVSLTFGFIGLHMALTGALRAAGNTFVPMVLALASRWLLQFPLALVLSHYTPLGAPGIWYSFAVTNVLTALFTSIWYKKKGGIRRYA